MDFVTGTTLFGFVICIFLSLLYKTHCNPMALRMAKTFVLAILSAIGELKLCIMFTAKIMNSNFTVTRMCFQLGCPDSDLSCQGKFFNVILVSIDNNKYSFHKKLGLRLATNYS